MRKSQIFVLFVIFLLPMSGCIDGSDAEEESGDQTVSSTNHHPVIYGYVDFGEYQHQNLTSFFDVLVSQNYAHAIDFDGTITQFGIDTNQDGVIDLEINQSNDGPGSKIVNGSDSEVWKNPTEYYFSTTSDVQFCYQWLSIIAVDDDGGKTVEPFIISFEYDDQNNECLKTSSYIILD